MFRFSCLAMFLVLGSEIEKAYTTEVTVKDKDDKLCLYANLMVNFTVTYEVVGKSNNTVEFQLPDVVNASGSSCGTDNSTLKLSFGNGHSWTINFTKEKDMYKADNIVLTYNLSDDSIFKNASSNGTVSVKFTPSIANVVVDTYYSCKSQDTVENDAVKQTLWNVALQAFVTNGSKSENETVCAKDKASTTQMPTTTTAATTVITATTAPPPVPPPSAGTYNLSAAGNGTICLLASMGLQISYNDSLDFQKVNLEPNKTTVTGACGSNNSIAALVLTSEKVAVAFTFIEEGKKFLLHAVNVTVKHINGTSFSAANTNLSLWQATLGSSYMCNKEQTQNITDTLSLYTLKLQVQPFEVKNDKFSTAHECSLDDTSILIPIIVGAALAGLIFIVVIAYLIGRRRTYVGYQTL
ncbi:lysosome-associated membrane glycoprotein 2-like isoform X2 [Megalops cyprinoides]|uniref:lysosome-associated membrane glycoprotein 2-like isoform X2 n=1 Tax=Megalops cyprinoides TaxID=118141 RepID=UPI001864B4E7|nr:lysosome-associated membrane glycoprotein 2-like isoform X2 [Megalops cyprinoides]